MLESRKNRVRFVERKKQGGEEGSNLEMKENNQSSNLQQYNLEFQTSRIGLIVLRKSLNRTE